MTEIIDERYAVHIDDYKSYDTDKLRQHFLIQRVFEEDNIIFVYTHYERIMVGGAAPTHKELKLEAVNAQQKASYFLERRELGIINIGGQGVVTVDGETYDLEKKEALYIGMGSKDVTFSSVNPESPAKFYLNSAPAHRRYPNKKVGLGNANVLERGSSETCNERRINQLLVNGIVETCQLQMGLTEFSPGSIWNTMPMHTHSRRMEAYFYFDLDDEQSVCHFMGPANETRHLWVKNEQAVVSPPWSMHSGVGTGSYAFIWGMAGENLDYDDMDFHPPYTLK